MPDGVQKGAGAIGVECIVPILRVSSLAASLRYYVQVLGFGLDWGGQDGSDIASVSLDGHAIMLCQGAQGRPGTWIWVGVEDIDPLYTEYREKGVQFLQTPTNHYWAYEMQLVDPDGHVLRFGSEPKGHSEDPSSR